MIEPEAVLALIQRRILAEANGQRSRNKWSRTTVSSAPICVECRSAAGSSLDVSIANPIIARRAYTIVYAIVEDVVVEDVGDWLGFFTDNSRSGSRSDLVMQSKYANPKRSALVFRQGDEGVVRLSWVEIIC